MNSTTTIVLSLLCASAAATGVTLLLRPAAETSPEDANAVAELQRAVDELRASNTALRSRIDALATAPAHASAPVAVERTAVPVVSNDQVAAAVEAYMHQRNGAAAPAADSSKQPTFDLDTEFSQLATGNYWSNTEAWKKAFAAGRMDEVVKRFEDLAKENPNEVKAQMNLANAYMAYLQMDQSKWALSGKADAVFDKVLALDNNHWEARFTKAVSYTFYPAFLGKSKDAIKHFETLVEQQELQPAQDYQAQTYLYLGNLLEQSDPARAKEVWAKGARRHPGNPELAKKLGQ